MARPERNDVDYFPFYCKEGKAMYFIEQTYGNDGYASWIKILRQLSVTNYHYLNLSDKVEFMYLSSKCRISQETLNSLVKDLCDLGEFNKELWDENKIIFSEKLVESLKDAYYKRTNECISLPSLLLLLDGLGVRKLSKSQGKGAGNPQTKVKYTKEDNIYREFDHLKISLDEVENLKKSSYTIHQIDGILDAIQNHKNKKSYTSLYLTCLNWLKRQYPNNQMETPVNPHTAILQATQFGRR